MATIKDVAKLAQVSVSTVSRVINNSSAVVPEKRDAVVKAMSDLNYKPNTLARALVSNKSDCIGLLVGELGSAFFSQMMEGIDDVIIKAGKHVIITSGYHNEKLEKEAIDFLLERRCDGLIVHSKAVSDEVLQQLAKGDTPVVFINRLVPGLEDRCIYLDNSHGAYMATRHLIARGHKEIAFVCTSLTDVADGQDRLAGYQRALEEAGLTFNEDLVARGFPNEEGGNYAIGEILSRKQPFTAVFGYNDQMAAGVINMLEDSGVSVPEQVSVVGFDDIVIAKYLRPKLTTIRYPINEMGAVAARNILHQIEPDNHGQVATPLRFTPRLIERHSVFDLSAR